MKCHYEGTGVLEGLCMGTKELDSCIGYERCTAFKPHHMTNADRWLKQPVKDGEGDV